MTPKLLEEELKEQELRVHGPPPGPVETSESGVTMIEPQVGAPEVPEQPEGIKLYDILSSLGHLGGLIGNIAPLFMDPGGGFMGPNPRVQQMQQAGQALGQFGGHMGMYGAAQEEAAGHQRAQEFHTQQQQLRAQSVLQYGQAQGWNKNDMQYMVNLAASGNHEALFKHAEAKKGQDTFYAEQDHLLKSNMILEGVKQDYKKDIALFTKQLEIEAIGPKGREEAKLRKERIQDTFLDLLDHGVAGESEFTPEEIEAALYANMIPENLHGGYIEAFVKAGKLLEITKPHRIPLFPGTTKYQLGVGPLPGAHLYPHNPEVSFLHDQATKHDTRNAMYLLTRERHVAGEQPTQEELLDIYEKIEGRPPAGLGLSEQEKLFLKNK